MESIPIQVLPGFRTGNQQQTGAAHTPYEAEVAFYSAIRSGDTGRVQEALCRLRKSTVVVGRLSENPVRQTRYWAVCCVAIATRYAISGGLHEAVAYPFADDCISRIDSMSREEQILDFLIERCLCLTQMVHDSKNPRELPPVIRRCIRLIDSGLFSPVRVPELAEQCGLSPDYLALLFRRGVGMSISRYVQKKRLEAARELLDTGMSLSRTASSVGFGSESYFIRCFREQFGMTPKQYVSRAPDLPFACPQTKTKLPK